MPTWKSNHELTLILMRLGSYLGLFGQFRWQCPEMWHYFWPRSGTPSWPRCCTGRLKWRITILNEAALFGRTNYYCLGFTPNQQYFIQSYKWSYLKVTLKLEMMSWQKSCHIFKHQFFEVIKKWWFDEFKKINPSSLVL